MSVPFRFEPTPKAPLADPPPDTDLGYGQVEIRCKGCSIPLTRQQIAPYDLVHVDDEIVFDMTGIKSMGKHDHAPNPDVIDVKVVL